MAVLNAHFLNLFHVTSNVKAFEDIIDDILSSSDISIWSYQQYIFNNGHTYKLEEVQEILSTKISDWLIVISQLNIADFISIVYDKFIMIHKITDYISKSPFIPFNYEISIIFLNTLFQQLNNDENVNIMDALISNILNNNNIVITNLKNISIMISNIYKDQTNSTAFKIYVDLLYNASQKSQYPISEEIHRTTLSLPISYGHTENEVIRIIEALNKF